MHWPKRFVVRWGRRSRCLLIGCAPFGAKPVSAAEMQFTYATRSPRASQIAGRVVCGSKVDIVARISARDSVAMEKSFLQLVFEVLCGATATLVQLLDCRPPHSLYTLASEPQPSVRESCVFCASSGGLS